MMALFDWRHTPAATNANRMCPIPSHQSDWYRAHVDWWDDYVTEPLQPLWRAVSAATSKAGEWTTAAVDAAMLFTS